MQLAPRHARELEQVIDQLAHVLAGRANAVQVLPAALVQGLVKELCEHFDAGKRLSRYPFEMLDENK